MEIKHRIQFGCDTDELADKVLSGEKTATSSLYDYSLMNQEEIKVNEYASILDSQGKEKCIVKIERIEIVDFQDITEEFAVNEGDGCLDNWIKIHTEYYSSLLEKIDKKLTGRTKLVCEWFSVTLSKILCKWKQDSVVSFFLYLDSVFKNKHKLIHNQSPVMNRLCPFLLNLHK